MLWHLSAVHTLPRKLTAFNMLPTTQNQQFFPLQVISLSSPRTNGWLTAASWHWLNALSCWHCLGLHAVEWTLWNDCLVTKPLQTHSVVAAAHNKQDTVQTTTCYVLTVVLLLLLLIMMMMIEVFWRVTPCRSVSGSWCLKGTQCLHVQTPTWRHQYPSESQELLPSAASHASKP
jgi:hypothetical protein